MIVGRGKLVGLTDRDPIPSINQNMNEMAIQAAVKLSTNTAI